VRSLAATRFWRLYGQLPEAVRRLADKNYRLWQRDPFHPALHFKKLKGSQELYSIRVGVHYRALGRVKGDLIRWLWIGTHQEYSKLVAQAGR
jgi:hypothetical protein